MEKHLYKKIYIITLCNFWLRSYSWPNTQHMQKFDTENLWFWRYCRSSVFTFVFFMQKLKGISSGQNNKSCSIIHHESNKIGFTIFWFICDFLRNLQESGKRQHYWSYRFARKTLERTLCSQCGPWGGWPARVGQIPANLAGVWPGRAGEGPRGAKGLILGAAGGEERPGNGSRRRSGKLATEAFGLASPRPGREGAVVLGGWEAVGRG
jgi:hypothetical protein